MEPYVGPPFFQIQSSLDRAPPSRVIASCGLSLLPGAFNRGRLRDSIRNLNTYG